MLIGVIAEELLDPLSVKPDIYIDGGIFARVLGPDSFWQARIYEIGFVAPLDPIDETAIGGAEVFGHTYVTQDYRGIFPDLFDDTVPERFYPFTQSFDPVLVSAFFMESDFFLSASLAVVAIHPSAVYVDSDIIYAPAFRSGLTPGLVVDDDVIRAQIIRRDGDPLVLLTEVFNDADIIYAANAAWALLPGVVNEHFPTGDVIYAASQGGRLQPALFDSGDTFFAPFIFNQLNPSRVLDTDVLLGPELRTPGRMGLFVDDDIFPVATVQFGALLPPLVTESDVFLSPFIGERPPIAPIDPVIDFQDTFYVPGVTIGLYLAPHLWPDVDDIKSVPGVILGQVIVPTVVFNDADAFYVPTLPPTLSPALFADTDVFFTPTLIFDQALLPSWIVETDIFSAPSMVALAGFDGTLASDGPIMPSPIQPTVIYLNILGEG